MSGSGSGGRARRPSPSLPIGMPAMATAASHTAPDILDCFRLELLLLIAAPAVQKLDAFVHPPQSSAAVLPAAHGAALEVSARRWSDGAGRACIDGSLPVALVVGVLQAVQPLAILDDLQHRQGQHRQLWHLWLRGGGLVDLHGDGWLLGEGDPILGVVGAEPGVAVLGAVQFVRICTS